MNFYVDKEVMLSSTHINIIRKYIDCYNSFDISGMLSFLSDDIHFTYVSAGMVTAQVSGKTAFEQYAVNAAKRFSVRETIIKSVDMDIDCIEVIVGHYAVLSTCAVNDSFGARYLSTTGLSKFVFEGDVIVELSEIL